MSGARVALGFLTRIPVADRAPLTAARLSAAAAWFPVVGLLVGGLAGGVRLLFDLFLQIVPLRLDLGRLPFQLFQLLR